MVSSIPFVVYWPTTQPGCQNKKCTYVNNKCLRSRNIRIITLTVEGLNECDCDVHKKVGVELLYNSVKTGSQLAWIPDLLVTECGRESQHLAERALKPSIEQFGDQTTQREDAGMRTGPWLSSTGERERNAIMANRLKVNMLQLCSVSNSLSNKVRGIFF